MKSRAYLVLALLLAAVLLFTFSGCLKSLDPTAEQETKPYQAVDSYEIKTVATSKVDSSIKDVSFDEALLSYIGANKSGNYMVSPLSFRYALGLMLAGAEGETKAELLTALGIKDEAEWYAYCETFNGFVEWFNLEYMDDQDEKEAGIAGGWLSPSTEFPERTLRVANSVWKKNTLPDFEADYKETVSRSFAAEYFQFTKSNLISRVNSWGDEKTNHLIPNLLPGDYDTSELAVVLMNAIYFKDSWVKPFEKMLNEDAPFYCKDGSTSEKTFMTREDHFSYYKDNDTELVTIPMAGGVYMTFVIGDTNNLSEKMAKAEYRLVRATIPKLNIETSLFELVDFLQERGAKKLFDRYDADFSGMIDYPVYINDIIQKTKLILDEEMVEAAAATGGFGGDGASKNPLQPIIFRADHAFHFYIHTTVNDAMTALLFAGEIVE